MFRKNSDINERGRQTLRGKETRKLISDILKQLPRIKEEELSLLFTNKSTVIQLKLQQRIIIYIIDNIPLFYSIDNKQSNSNSNSSNSSNNSNDIYPTVFTLWKLPHALRCFIIHAPVSKFILKGAALMLPGLANTNDIDGIILDEKVCVRVKGNPLPFAIGNSLTSWAAILQNRCRGKAMTVDHCFGDFLYLLASHVIPNSGYTLDCIYALEGYMEDGVDDDDDDDDGNEEGEDGDDGNDGNDENDDNDDGNTKVSEENADSDNEHTRDALDANATATGTDDKINQNDNNNNDANDDDDDTNDNDNSKEIMDNILQRTLLLAIKYVIRDGNLPMLASAFWSLLQKCAPDDDDCNIDLVNFKKPIHLDAKRSSYRKPIVFLHAMVMKDLLVMKDTNGTESIITVGRSHDLFKGINVTDPMAYRSRVQNSVSSNSNSNDKNSSTTTGGAKDKKISLTELFKLPRNYKDTFGVTRGQFGEHLTFGEVKATVLGYLKTQQFEHTDKAYVVIPYSSPLYKVAASVVEPEAEPEKDVEVNQIKKNTNVNDAYEDTDMPPSTSGSVVAGIWMPSVLSQVTGGKEKVDEDIVKEKKETIWKPISLPAEDKKPPVDKKKEKQLAKLKEEQEARPITIRKDDLFQAFLTKLSPYYAITQANGQVNVSSGTPPYVDIIEESRVGNKMISRVYGLHYFGFNIKTVAKDWKKSFATSVTVSQVPHNPKEEEIVAQGALSYQIQEYIINNMKLPQNLVQIQKKKGKKK